jgi:hypothetical protein
MEDTMQPADLTPSEQRAVMLETHTPAYARTIENRRAIDDIYRESRQLKRITGMRHQVMPMIPFESTFVSGLNVPQNLHICVADKGEPVEGQLWSGIGAHQKLRGRALRGLEARNV